MLVKMFILQSMVIKGYSFNYLVPTILGKQEINYPELEKLCSIGGLGHRFVI